MAFPPNPPARATCGGTVSCISIFTAIIQRPKASNQRPGELIGEGARLVFGQPEGATGPEPANN
jgi:hypothetical protein